MLVVIFDEVALGSGLRGRRLREVSAMLAERTSELSSTGFLLERMIERRMLVDIWIAYIPWTGVSGVHK